MAAIDLVRGSVGVVLTVTVTSSDVGYAFGDVTGAQLELSRGSLNALQTFTRTADSFSIVANDLVIVYTTVAEDLEAAGTLYLVPIALRAAGALRGERTSLNVGI